MIPRDDSPAAWELRAADVREYWSWIAGALYLLLTVDLLTTLYATDIYGPAAEANPYMRWALERDVLAVVGLNLAALAVLVVLFQVYVRLLARVDGIEGWVLARSFECWLGGLLAAGLFVFANNLAVIFFGESLL